MADQGPQHELAKAVIPFEADTSAVERSLDAIDDRVDDLGDKLGKVMDPLLVKLEEFKDGIDEARDRAVEQALTPAGETVTGPSGVTVTPLGPAASMTETTRLVVVMEDVHSQLRELNENIRALISVMQEQ